MFKRRDFAAANAALAQVADADLANYFRGLVQPKTSNPGSEKVQISDYEYARFYQAAHGVNPHSSAAIAQPSTKAHWFPKSLVLAWAIRLDEVQNGVQPDLSEIERFHKPVPSKP